MGLASRLLLSTGALIALCKIATAQTLTPVPEPQPPAPQPAPPTEPPPVLTPVPEPPPGTYPTGLVPGTGVERRGLMLGLGFGGGWVHPTSNLADDYWGFATEFHIGGMINPRLAILFNTSSIYRWVGYDTTVWLHTDAFCLQFWAHDRVYLRAGGGFAFLQAADNWDGFLIDAGMGGSIAAGIGVELMQQRFFVVDLQVRYQGTWFDDIDTHGVTMFIGLNWY